MRYAARIDANQVAIVQALRAVGASVQSLAAVGKGVPDLLVGYRGKNLLIEVKDGARFKSQRKLTDHQATWLLAWKGSPVLVVETVTEALGLLGV